MSIRRLAPGDEAVLERLAREDPDFGLDRPGKPAEPLAPDAAIRYLQDPAVLHWVAEDGAEVVGHLQCILLPLRAGDGRELLLYDIGVRRVLRRRGVGRALVGCMESWMRANGVGGVWGARRRREARHLRCEQRVHLLEYGNRPRWRKYHASGQQRARAALL